MEDVTLIIQGRILQDTYDFYIKNYKDFPVIISTWVDNKVNFENGICKIESTNSFAIIL